MSFGYGKGIQQYQQTSTYSGAAYADPHRLTQMLMEGLLERIAQAKGAMQVNNVPMKGERLGKAISILDGLKASLDTDKGGEIAQNLADLYDYMQRQLLHANIANDVAALDEVAALMSEIKQAWDAIPPDLRNGAA